MLFHHYITQMRNGISGGGLEGLEEKRRETCNLVGSDSFSLFVRLEAS